jgi:hypothetical protein
LLSSISLFQLSNNSNLIEDAKAISNSRIQGGRTTTIDIPVAAATPKNGQYFTPENTQLPTNSKVI